MFFSRKQEESPDLILETSNYKTNIFDNFKVDVVVLACLIAIAWITIFNFSFKKSQDFTRDANQKTIQTGFAKITEFKEVGDKIENMHTSWVKGDKLSGIFSFLESLNIGDYKIEFDNYKKVYYIALQDVSPDLLNKVKELNQKKPVVDLKNTYATINIAQASTINFKIIFY